MSKFVTHITFAKGTEIKSAFASALSPEQRRDPDKSDGYWLVNLSEKRVRELAELHGQTFDNLTPDFHHLR